MLLYYGSEIFGLVTSVCQFVSYFTLVEAGLSSVAVYSLYKPLAEKNYREINGILSASRIFYDRTGHIFTLLVLVLSFVYPFLIQTDVLSIFEIIILVLLIGAAAALDFYTMSKYRVLLTADQKIYVISMANIFYVILNILIVYVGARLNMNVIVLRACMLVSIVSRSIILFLYVKGKYPYVNYREVPQFSYISKRWDAFYLQALGVIHTGAPVILITLLCTLSDVSIFSVFNVVMAGITGVLSIFTNSLYPSFGEIIIRNDRKLLQKSFAEFELIYYSILAVIVGCSFVLLLPFVELYTNGVHDINYKQPLLSFLIVFNILFHNTKTPQGMLVISAGLFKETRVQTTIQGLLVIIAGILFGYLWGVTGVVLGMVVSNIYRTIDLLIFISKNVTMMRIRDSLLRLLSMGMAIVVIVCLGMKLNLHVSSWWDWMQVAFKLVSISFVVICFSNFLLSRSTFTSVICRLKCLIK